MSVEDRVRDGLRAQAEGTKVPLPPVDDVFSLAGRQRVRPGAAVVSAVLIIAVGVVAAVSVLQPPRVEFFDEPDSVGGEKVPVPDVQGLSLTRAEQALRATGLTGGPTSGPGWEDPDEPEAVVVSQEPPPGTLVEHGDEVGFRTALINPELCAVFTQLPPRQGDAHDLARTDGYWDMLGEARTFADPRLAGYIDDLLDHHAVGAAVEEAPDRALDSVTIHHDACSQGATAGACLSDEACGNAAIDRTRLAIREVRG